MPFFWRCLLALTVPAIHYFCRLVSDFPHGLWSAPLTFPVSIPSPPPLCSQLNARMQLEADEKSHLQSELGRIKADLKQLQVTSTDAISAHVTAFREAVSRAISGAPVPPPPTRSPAHDLAPGSPRASSSVLSGGGGMTALSPRMRLSLSVRNPAVNLAAVAAAAAAASSTAASGVPTPPVVPASPLGSSIVTGGDAVPTGKAGGELLKGWGPAPWPKTPRSGAGPTS